MFDKDFHLNRNQSLFGGKKNCVNFFSSVVVTDAVVVVIVVVNVVVVNVVVVVVVVGNVVNVVNVDVDTGGTGAARSHVFADLHLKQTLKKASGSEWISNEELFYS